MSESQEATNVVEARTRFLAELKQQVDVAYQNRSVETYLPEEKNTAEAIARAHDLQAKIRGHLVAKKTDNQKKEGDGVLPDKQAKSEDVFIDTGEFEPHPSAAYVSNSHDYPDLIRASLEKLADEGHYDRKDIPEKVQEILEHEYEHHVPALDQEGMQVRYLIDFVEDRKKRIVGMRPAIVLTGHFSVKLQQEIVNAAKNPSATDKIGGELLPSKPI